MHSRLLRLAILVTPCCAVSIETLVLKFLRTHSTVDERITTEICINVEEHMQRLKGNLQLLMDHVAETLVVERNPDILLHDIFSEYTDRGEWQQTQRTPVPVNEAIYEAVLAKEAMYNLVLQCTTSIRARNAITSVLRLDPSVAGSLLNAVMWERLVQMQPLPPLWVNIMRPSARPPSSSAVGESLRPLWFARHLAALLQHMPPSSQARSCFRAFVSWIYSLYCMRATLAVEQSERIAQSVFAHQIVSVFRK